MIVASFGGGVNSTAMLIGMVERGSAIQKVGKRYVSKIKIMLPQAKRLGYSVRVHENLLVFRKPT